MRLVRVEETTDIDLMPLGDVHVGSKDFDEKKFLDTVEWIRKTPNARVVLMGDMIDAGLRDSIGGGCFDNDIDVESQMEYIVEALKPINKKIWCMYGGNHEERVRMKTSIDVNKLIASQLGISYVGASSFIKAKIGKANYIIYGAHGSSGSSMPTGKLNAVIKLGTFVNADLIMMGHVHELMNHTSEYFRVDIGNKQIIKDKKHYVLTGHFLKYGGYAQAKNMLPGKTGVAKIRLNKDKKDIHVSI